MSGSNSHIQSLVFDLHLATRENAYQLQNTISRLFTYQVSRLLEQFFDERLPPDFIVKMETLTLDLGSIAYEQLENELPDRLMQALQKLFYQPFSPGRYYAGSMPAAYTVLTTETGYLRLLYFFLRTGTLPWWAGSLSADKIEAFVELLCSQHSQQLRRLLLAEGRNEGVRRRISLQFSEKIIKRIIVVLEPEEALFIFAYHKSITRQQQQYNLVKSGTEDFKRAVWFFILSFLLAERETWFNRKAFIRSSLRQMAAHFNVQYESLLLLLYQALYASGVDIEQAKLTWFVKIVLEEELQQAEATVLLQPAPATAESPLFLQVKNILAYFITTGTVPPWSEYAAVNMSALLEQLLQQQPLEAIALFRWAGDTDKTKNRFLYQFDTELVLKVIGQLPAGAIALQAYTYLLNLARQTAGDRGLLAGASPAKTFLRLLWSQYASAGYRSFDETSFYVQGVTGMTRLPAHIWFSVLPLLGRLFSRRDTIGLQKLIHALVLISEPALVNSPHAAVALQAADNDALGFLLHQLYREEGRPALKRADLAWGQAEYQYLPLLAAFQGFGSAGAASGDFVPAGATARAFMPGDVASRNYMPAGSASREYLPADAASGEHMSAGAVSREYMPADAASASGEYMPPGSASREYLPVDAASRKQMFAGSASREYLPGGAASGEYMSEGAASQEYLQAGAASPAFLPAGAASRGYLSAAAAANRMAIVAGTMAYFLTWNELPAAVSLADAKQESRLLAEMVVYLFINDRTRLKTMLQAPVNAYEAKKALYRLFSLESGGREALIARFLAPFMEADLAIYLHEMPFATDPAGDRQVYNGYSITKATAVLNRHYNSNNATLPDEQQLLAKALETLDYFFTWNKLPVGLPVEIADQSAFVQYLFRWLFHKNYNGLSNLMQKTTHQAAARIQVHDWFTAGTFINGRSVRAFTASWLQQDVLAYLHQHTGVDIVQMPVWQHLVSWRQMPVAVISYLARRYQPATIENWLQQKNSAWFKSLQPAVELLHLLFSHLPGSSLAQDWPQVLLKELLLLSLSEHVVVKDATGFLQQFFTYIDRNTAPPVYKVYEKMQDAFLLVKQQVPAQGNELVTRMEREIKTRLLQAPVPMPAVTSGSPAAPEPAAAMTAIREMPVDVLSKIYVQNAGLILLHPFFSIFFTRLQLVEKGKFVSQSAACRAMHLLQYLVDGACEHEEHLLVLNKLLCNIPLQEPVPLLIEPLPEEMELADELFKVLFQQWDKMKNGTVEGFRQSFLQREGVLLRKEDHWVLKVEQRGYDLLLQTLPWAYGTIKLPWMKEMLYVEWV